MLRKRFILATTLLGPTVFQSAYKRYGEQKVSFSGLGRKWKKRREANSITICLPNEDFGKDRQKMKIQIFDILSMLSSPNRVLTPLKMRPSKSRFPLLSILPKSSFGKDRDKLGFSNVNHESRLTLKMEMVEKGDSFMTAGEYTTLATKRWKVRRKRFLKGLFGLPKSLFGEHRSCSPQHNETGVCRGSIAPSGVTRRASRLWRANSRTFTPRAKVAWK